MMEMFCVVMGVVPLPKFFEDPQNQEEGNEDNGRARDELLYSMVLDPSLNRHPKMLSK